MDSLYVYVLKVNIALVVFWFFCRLVFGRDTFLGIKRTCLLTVLGLSFVYPLIDIADWIKEEQQVIFVRYAMDFQNIAFSIMPQEEVVVLTWERVLWGIYLAGVLFLSVRMLVQLWYIGRFVRIGTRLNCLGAEIVSPGSGIAPFSFCGWIFMHPDDYTLREMQEIVAHEKAHVVQWHSVDMLLSEFICIIFWFNPAVWLLRHEIRQNLEFLADQDVVEAGYNRKNYQYHLLRLSHQSTAVQIVNNFNVSQLKKRIIMMNKRKTSRAGLLKYALLVPVTGLLIMSSNVQALANLIPAQTVSQEVADKPQTDKKIKVTGLVVDQTKAPISGAIAIVKGTEKGTTTNTKGNFVLDLNEGDVVVVSYVGKETVEIEVKGSKDVYVTIELKPEARVLDRVQVIGYRSEKAKGNIEVMEVVESTPQFPGGETALKTFLIQNVKYPVVAQEKGIVGEVMVGFTVSEAGKIVDPKIITSVAPELDQEALRIVKMMPDWTPAKQKGVPVAYAFVVPINFALSLNGVVTGVTKISQGLDQPLYVVNGVVMPETFKIGDEITADEVQSISVLKDKSAIEVYGEKGKNGVIIITLKKKAGQE